MPKWYSGPIGTMWVFNGQGESPTANFASALFKAGVPVSQVVTNPNIDFDVWVQYDDHPLVGHGRGYFQVDLFKWSGNTWLLIDSQSETLGTDNDSGQWGDWITVSVKMAEIVEQYQIRLYCETQDVTISHNDQAFFYPNAIQSFDYLGDFTLDFIPLSIVYSPPGQDMTASLWILLVAGFQQQFE